MDGHGYATVLVFLSGVDDPDGLALALGKGVLGHEVDAGFLSRWVLFAECSER